jgi:predicted RNase H-like HicB family nuclease
MFSEYVEKAVAQAKYTQLEDGTFFAEIAGFDGVRGNGTSIQECRADLQDALEGWLILGLWDHDEDLPTVGGLSLIPRPAADEDAKQKKNKSGTASASRAGKAS